MTAIAKTVQQALRVGIKDVLEPDFHCVRHESSADAYFEAGRRLTKTLGYRCHWPGQEAGPEGFGKLHYNFSIYIEETIQNKVAIHKMTYLMWEGRIERWDAWKNAKAYDTNLDGTSDTIIMETEPSKRVEYQWAGGEWYRYRQARCEGKVHPSELTEIIEPTQEAYSLALALSGLLLVQP